MTANETEAGAGSRTTTECCITEKALTRTDTATAGRGGGGGVGVCVWGGGCCVAVKDSK